jgi:glycosyltransferase involved in cell wall biosynthesis
MFTLSLSIAIPTYNRHESISRRINEVARLNFTNLQIWISDNSQDLQTQKVISNSTYGPIIYKRNEFNIGGGANFIQSLLLGKSDYVWLRGDDDPISSEQFDAIVGATKYSPDIIIISRSTDKVVFIKSINDFFSNFEITQAAGWLSMIVFKQDSLRFGMKWGYWGVRSGWANVSLILGILRDSPFPLCVVVPATLTSSDFREEGRNSRKWAVIETCIDNFPSLFTMLISPNVRKHAYYHWRKTQGLGIVRTYARSRLGLAPIEKVSSKTFLNLLSSKNPRSSSMAFLIFLIRFTPQFILAYLFSFGSLLLSDLRLKRLEMDYFIGLSPYRRFKLIREMQKHQRIGLASSFL